jgi:hypothetical protein
VFEFLLNYPSSRYLEGSIEVVLSWASFTLLMSVTAAGCWWGMRYARLEAGPRRTILYLIRVTLVGLMLFVLLDPRLVTPASGSAEGELVVMLDDSASMTLPGANGVSRREQMLTLFGPDAGTVTQALKDRFSIRYIRVGATSAAIQTDADVSEAAGTSAVERALRTVADKARPPSAVILASDGGVKPTKAMRRELLRIRAAGVEFHTVHIPGDNTSVDVSIEQFRVPPRTYVNDRLKVRALVRHVGIGEGTLDVRLESGGLLVGVQKLPITAGQDVSSVEFEYEATETGYHDLVIQVAPDPRERVVINNQRNTGVEVVKRQLDVLHYEAEPRFEVKFARRALSADPLVNIVSVIRTAENKYYRLGVSTADQHLDGFPRRVEDLFDYEMVIIGSVGRDDLDAEQSAVLRDFVTRRGGGVLFLGGRRALAEGGLAQTSIADILPVRLGPAERGFRQRLNVMPSAHAQTHPLALLAAGTSTSTPFADMPALTVINPLRTPRPGATVLFSAQTLQGDPNPLIMFAHHRVGRGTVAVMPVRDLWRWQMHSSVPLEDQTHELAWQRLVRWLAGAAPPRLQAHLSERRVSPGERITVEVQAFDASYQPARQARFDTTRVTADGRKLDLEMEWQQVSPGLYEATFRVAEVGVSSIKIEMSDELGQAQMVRAHFEVSGMGTEFDTTAANAVPLHALSQLMDGSASSADTAEQVLGQLSLRRTTSTTLERLPLWNAPALSLAVLLAMCLAWALRRRWGLA